MPPKAGRPRRNFRNSITSPYAFKYPYRNTMGRRSIGKIRKFLPLSGFPEKKVVKLRYVETILMESSSALTQTYAFSCNSAYDPNQSGSGHQPYGFDQWALIYNHYKVLGSKMKLTVSGAGQAQTGTIYGIKVDDDASISSNINQLMEQKDSKYNVIIGQNAPSALFKKWSLRKTMDPTNDGVSAIVGASPADQEYYVIYAGCADGASAFGKLALQVQIDYIIQFTEMKDFANS